LKQSVSNKPHSKNKVYIEPFHLEQCCPYVYFYKDNYILVSILNYYYNISNKQTLII